jgi:hypothetical protein
MSEELKKRVLTEEVRKNLLGDMPFSSTATMPYTPPHFVRKDKEGNYVLPPEFRAVFNISGLTKPQKQEAKSLVQRIAASFKDDKELSEKEQGQFMELCRLNLKGWQNVFDTGTCEEILFEEDPDGGADAETFLRLPESIISSIFFEQVRISGLLDTTKLGLKS